MSSTSDRLSIAEGPPLESEEGLGALTLPGYLCDLRQRHAAREALVLHEDDGRCIRWSYAELYERAAQVAAALIADGLPKGACVGVLMTNRPEWLASVFGITMAGGVAAPLSTFSTPAELAYLLETSCVSTLLVERRVLKKDFLAILRELEPSIATARPAAIASAKFPFLRRIVAWPAAQDATGAAESWDAFLASGQAVTRARVEARMAAVKPADPALLYFSSGSTGRPKGILNAHRGVAIQCWRWRRLLNFNVDMNIRGWGANGFFWSGAFAQTVGATLSSGGSIVLQPTFDARKALELFERERVNYLVCWPHQYAQFAAAPNWRTVNLSSLKYISRGTALDEHPTVQYDWPEPVWAFGSTETFTLSTCFPSGTPPQVCANTHGVPLPGNRVKIVDPFTGEIVPQGTRGEIAVKGPTLMLGYIGVPRDETLDDEGYFHSGDGGYIDAQGRLIWEGRLNDVIKTGGANVSPLEIDEVLRACPGVKISQTVGIPDPLYGEVIVSCIVTNSDADRDAERIKAFAKERLASYKVPKRVLFLEENEIKTTGSSKIVTAELRKLAAERLSTRAGA